VLVVTFNTYIYNCRLFWQPQNQDMDTKPAVQMALLECWKCV